MSYEEFTITINKGKEEPLFFRIGKCAQGNFDIIDLAQPDDIWFHVEGRSSAHVVLSAIQGNKKQRRAAIVQGAVLCKQRSKYSSEPHLQIVYTEIKHVTKTDTVGLVEIVEGRIQVV